MAIDSGSAQSQTTFNPGVSQRLSLALHRRVHYAWVVLACALIAMAITAGARNAFGVFLPALVERFGWSVGTVSFAYVLQYVPAIPFTLLAGSLADRFGARRIVLVGAVVFVAAMLLTSTVQHLWQFYLYYAVLVSGVNIVFGTILAVTVTLWFERRRGLAVGIASTATGVGTFVLAPLFGWLLPTVGWAAAFWVIGGAAGGIVLMAALLLRSYPRDLGIRAFGEAPQKTATRVAARSASGQVSLGQVQRTYAFWALIAAHGLGCLGHAVLLAHIVRMGILEGMPAVAAAGLLSTVQGVSVFSRFGMPMLAERWGGRSTLVVGYVAQGLAILLYLWADGAASLYAISVVFGLGLGAEMTAFPIINRQFYGAGAPLNSVHAWEIVGALVGMGLGGWLGGVLFDLRGSYAPSIWLGGLATLSALPLIAALPGRSARLPIVAAAQQIPGAAAPRP